MPSCDSDSDSDVSSTLSFDEDELNHRLTPHWAKYRAVIESRGFHLDTFHDVKEFYHRYWEEHKLQRYELEKHMAGYTRACRSQDDSALCKDAGLPDNLFRGSRICDKAKVVVKAVHLRSREFDVIRFLSTPPLRDDPMNHCIPVLDLIDIPDDGLAFIVMEEWSSHFVPHVPSCLRLFLVGLRQCIEHTVFMHKYCIAHLDISVRNILTDYKARYAAIDYELSQRFDGVCNPRICDSRGTEIPPELERGEASDPYKVDIWALGVLILRGCQLAGFNVPELLHLIRPMLQEKPDDRPTACQVLKAFNRLVAMIGADRMETCNQPLAQ